MSVTGCNASTDPLRNISRLHSNTRPVILLILRCDQVDEKTGRMTGQNRTYAICGNIRRMVSNIYELYNQLVAEGCANTYSRLNCRPLPLCVAAVEGE